MTPDRAGVFGGVDTHKDVHVAAAVDAAGRLLGTAEFAADSRGYDQLAGWLESWGAVGRVGVEGNRILRCGPHPAPHSRGRRGGGGEPPEPPDAAPPRQDRHRRRRDRSPRRAQRRRHSCAQVRRRLRRGDPHAVAGAALSGQGPHRRRQPDQRCRGDRPRAPQRPPAGLKTPEMVKVCARWRIDASGDPAAGAAKRALRALASRHRALTAEIEGLDAELLALCERANPALLGTCGVGAEVASALLVAAGDNPQRMRSEASFAALCGTSPIEASSGPRVRHRPCGCP